MNFMPINAKKINFSENEVNVIQMGVELVKRHLYGFDKDVYKKYSTFSNVGGIDYKAHNDGFFEKAIEAAYDRSGISPEKTNIALAFRMQNFERAFFSVIEEVIDNVNSKNEIEEILTFADVRNMAEGDSMLVEVKPINAYFFYKTGRGASFQTVQRYNSRSVTLTPQVAEATIAFNRKDIIANRVDWGREVARAVRGLRSGYFQDIATLVFSTTASPIGNKLISTGGYSETDFRTQIQLLQAKNGSSNTVIYGTNLALAPILPTNTQLQLGLGIEYMDKGYLATPFGHRAIELPQALKADNATLIVPNNYVVGMSLDVSKPIMIGISGETRVETMVPEQNASDDYLYTVKSDWDVKMAGQGFILIYRTV